MWHEDKDEAAGVSQRTRRLYPLLAPALGQMGALGRNVNPYESPRTTATASVRRSLNNSKVPRSMPLIHNLVRLPRLADPAVDRAAFSLDPLSVMPSVPPIDPTNP